MLNRTPPSNTNTTNTLNAYRKRRQFFKGPFMIYTAAGVLLIAGIIALVIWANSGGNSPVSGLFATKTPTATLTFTPTITTTPSLTPTLTLTPTITITPTPTGPIDYTIKEGDTLQSIADQFNLGSDGVPLLLDFNDAIMKANGVYYVGQTIKIPPAGTVRNTPTPLPPLGRGAKIQYTVQPGDTLAGIAAKFNSTTDDIITLNKLDNPNALQAGQTLQIPVNLVTSTATLPASSTPVSPTVAGQPTQAAATAATTPLPAGTASTSDCVPTENATFVSDMQTLINTARTMNGLSALTPNDKLTAAAKAHAIDMACNNYLSHIGLNNSTPEFRVAAQGYNGSFVVENLYALNPVYGINPQTAFNWWMNNDATSHSNILNPDVTEFGVAYVVYDKSLLGGYFVVIFAKP